MPCGGASWQPEHATEGTDLMSALECCPTQKKKFPALHWKPSSQLQGLDPASDGRDSSCSTSHLHSRHQSFLAIKTNCRKAQGLGPGPHAVLTAHVLRSNFPSVAFLQVNMLTFSGTAKKISRVATTRDLNGKMAGLYFGNGTLGYFWCHVCACRSATPRETSQSPSIEQQPAAMTQ